MSILITGAAGFIGSALVHELNRQGATDLILCDQLRSGEKWKNLVGLRYRDYLEKDSLFEDLDSYPIDFVYHLGACSSTTETDASYLVQNNFNFSKKLARYCLSRDLPMAYASSAATYGDGSQGFDDRCDPHSLRPLNMYGYSKQMFDLWLLEEGHLNTFTGLKFFNVFGPNENHKGSMRSMVHKAYEQIQNRGFVELFKSHHPDYEDGCQLRDFVYIKDVTRTLVELSRTSKGFGLLNLGRGEAISWLELINPIFEALQMRPDIRFIDMPIKLREKYQYYTCATMQKAQGIGLSVPMTSIQGAVMDTVQNYLISSRTLGTTTGD